MRSLPSSGLTVLPSHGMSRPVRACLRRRPHRGEVGGAGEALHAFLLLWRALEASLGIGDAKLFRFRASGLVRVFMRRVETTNVIGNFVVDVTGSELCAFVRPTIGEESWQWSAHEYSQGACPKLEGGV